MTTPQVNEDRLEHYLTALEMARSWGPRTVSKLETMIRTAEDYDLFRINPFTFAAEKSIDETEAIDLFLHGVQVGLFEMEWHLVCALCGHIVDSMQEIGKLHPHFACDFCGLDNNAALDDFIQVGFTLAADVRDNAYRHPGSLKIEDYYFRYHWSRGILPYGGVIPWDAALPSLTRAMEWIPPGESRTYELDPGPGSFHAKDLANRATLTLFLGDPEDKTWVVPIDLEEGRFKASNPELDTIRVDVPQGSFEYPHAAQVNAGPLEIKFTNHMDRPCPFWLLHYPPNFVPHLVEFEPFLSGKRLLTNQTFRDLFRGVAVSQEETIAIKDATYLFTDIKGSTDLYDRVGDPNAFFMVLQHFEALTQAIRDNNGALVKTIGDAVMAIFMEPEDGIKAALEMLSGVEKMVTAQSEKIILKIGLNRGHSIVVSLDNRLDYFGQTVNIAARVQGIADAGEIVVTEEVFLSQGVKAALEGKTISTEEVRLKGVGAPVKVYRVKP